MSKELEQPKRLRKARHPSLDSLSTGTKREDYVILPDRQKVAGLTATDKAILGLLIARCNEGKPVTLEEIKEAYVAAINNPGISEDNVRRKLYSLKAQVTQQIEDWTIQKNETPNQTQEGKKVTYTLEKKDPTSSPAL